MWSSMVNPSWVYVLKCLFPHNNELKSMLNSVCQLDLVLQPATTPYYWCSKLVGVMYVLPLILSALTAWKHSHPSPMWHTYIWMCNYIVLVHTTWNAKYYINQFDNPVTGLCIAPVTGLWILLTLLPKPWACQPQSILPKLTLKRHIM